MSIASMFGYVSLNTFIGNIKNTIKTHLSREPYHSQNRFHDIFGINGVSFQDEEDFQFPAIVVIKEDDFVDLVAIRNASEYYCLGEDGFRSALEEDRKKLKLQLADWPIES